MPASWEVQEVGPVQEDRGFAVGQGVQTWLSRYRNTLVKQSPISQEGTSSAHKKLRKAYQLYETGVPITKALEMAADGDGELYMIAAILEIGAISGGDTASLLWRLFEILRRRRMFRGEVNARLSEARLTSRLLLALPWIIGFSPSGTIRSRSEGL